MGKVKDRMFWESARYNNLAFRMYYDRILEIALSRFDWQNLPETMDERYLELTLFSYGSAVVFKNDVGDLVFTRMTQAGGFDIYGTPVLRNANANNGFHVEGLTPDDSVIVWNNMLRSGSMELCEYYAKRLWDLDRSVDVNAKAQKTPVLVRCKEGQRMTLKNAYEKYEGNQPVIWADKEFDTSALGVFKTDAPYVADRLYELRNLIWSEALTWLGISNTNIQKKERLLTDEVVRNQGGIVASRRSPLKMRQDACEKINKMFGTDIRCEFASDALEQLGGDEVAGEFAEAKEGDE